MATKILLKHTINGEDYKPAIRYSTELNTFVAEDANGKVCVLESPVYNSRSDTPVPDGDIPNSLITYNVVEVNYNTYKGHFRINHTGMAKGSITFYFWKGDTSISTQTYTFSSITNISPTDDFYTEEFRSSYSDPNMTITINTLQKYKPWGGE